MVCSLLSYRVVTLLNNVCTTPKYPIICIGLHWPLGRCRSTKSASHLYLYIAHTTQIAIELGREKLYFAFTRNKFRFSNFRPLPCVQYTMYGSSMQPRLHGGNWYVWWWWLRPPSHTYHILEFIANWINTPWIRIIINMNGNRESA